MNQLLKEVRVEDYYFDSPVPARAGQYYGDVFAWLIGNADGRKLTIDVLRVVGMTSDGRIGTASTSDVFSSSRYDELKEFVELKCRYCFLSVYVK